MVNALQLYGTLKKWHVAILAADLGMWRHLPLPGVSPDTWFASFGTNLPDDFEHALSKRHPVKDKEFRRWVANVQELGRRGILAYTDVATRVCGLASTVDPSSIPPDISGSYFDRVACMLPKVHNDRALAAAISVVSFFASFAQTVQPRRGSLTDMPVTWTVASLQWTAGDMMPSFPNAPSSVTLLTASALHILHPQLGAHTYDCTFEDAPVWIASKSNFRKHVYIVGTATRLYEVRIRHDTVESTCVATFPGGVLPSSNLVDKPNGYVCWVQAKQPVALCLDSYTLISDAGEVDAFMAQARETGAVAACGRFIYEGGSVIATLPRDQDIVAVVGARHATVDAFTRSGDWWRIEKGRGTVVGLSIEDVRDAVANK